MRVSHLCRSGFRPSNMSTPLPIFLGHEYYEKLSLNFLGSCQYVCTPPTTIQWCDSLNSELHRFSKALMNLFSLTHAHKNYFPSLNNWNSQTIISVPSLQTLLFSMSASRLCGMSDQTCWKRVSYFKFRDYKDETISENAFNGFEFFFWYHLVFEFSSQI